MDHRADVRVLREDAIDQLPVRDITLVELPARRHLASATDQTVQDYRIDPGIRANRGNCASDVARAPAIRTRTVVPFG